MRIGREERGFPSEAWFISFETSGSAAKDYQIVTNFDPEDDGVAAFSLTFISEESGDSRMSALGGTMSVLEGPQDISEWQSGTDLRIEVRAEFAEEPIRTVVCEGGGEVDAPETDSETCTCEDSQGNRSTCERTTPQEDCCASTAPTFVFETTLVAEQCPYFCAETHASSDGCAGLMP